MDAVGTSLLDWYRAENERLRAALDLIANWSSRTADEHGHVGVREFARQVIDPNHPLGADGGEGSFGGAEWAADQPDNDGFSDG